MSRKRRRPADDRLATQGGAGLTKSGLTDRVYKRHGGLTKNEAAGIVEKIFDTLKTNLSDGRPVKIQNFGVFEVVPRQGRTGVNPANGEKIFIPPHKGLSFRPSPRLRDAVDEPDDES